MIFARVYRLSLYGMLFLTTLVLNIDSDEWYARFFPPAFAVAALVAYLTVDRDPKWGLSRWTANILAIGAFVLGYIEFRSDESRLVLACGHVLTYLTVVKLFLPKTIEDDWFLFLLGLVQVLVGGFLAQSDLVGLILFAWALAGLWVLGLFHLHREALRAGWSPQSGGPEPYPGLLGPAFFFAAARAASTTLVLGGFIFLAMPRSAANSSFRGRFAGTHLTGFTDEVQLGQLGEILENEAVVMSVELTDELGARVEPESELLWRGLSLVDYEYRKGKWSSRSSSHNVALRDFPQSRPRTGKLIRQQIRLEPTDSPYVFGHRPIHQVIVRPDDLLLINEFDGSLVRDKRLRINKRAQPLDYALWSAVGGDGRQPGEFYPDAGLRQQLRQIDPAMRRRLEPIARAHAGTAGKGPEQAARQLEAWLRDSGTFHYDLRMERSDRELDPIEDFLINRRRGHCEYFASGLAMLLRSLDVPTRVVNGFKGGDWNELARVLTVRQKHAHSWVEALVGSDPRTGGPIWIELDPTPAGERELSVAEVGGVPFGIRQLGDFVRYVWIFYIAGFNADRQEKILYGPARALLTEARRGFGIMYDAARAAVRWLLDFRDVRSIFDVRVLLATGFAMLVAAGGFVLVRWLRRRWAGRRGRGDDHDGGAAGLAAYRRLADLLAGSGLKRPSAETPREFAGRAARFLGDRGDDLAALVDLPPLVVDTYYRSRFGRLEPAAELVRALDSRLDALESGLKPHA